MDRVFLKDFDGGSLSDRDTLHHLRRVLRLGPGDTFTGTDGRTEWVLRIDEAKDAAVRVSTVDRREIPAAVPRVTVGQALLKKPRWEVFLEKMTELGAAEIVPVRAERCVAKPDDFDDRAGRWERIVERAVAQSHGAMPGLHPPETLEAFLARGAALRLACSTDPAAPPVAGVLDGAGAPESVALLIGPEGDFSPEEQARIGEAGFLPVSLGPRVLRAETASIVALAAVMLYSEGKSHS